MARAISNRNLCDAQFTTADFDGAWLRSFGKPELRGAWLIFGESGSGKTHFALELLKYLSRFVERTAYDSLEQGFSLSFQRAWNDADMQSIGSKVVILNKEEVPVLRERLKKRKSPQVIVIDSITALSSFTRPMFANLLNEFPNKLFIFIAHEQNHQPYPAIAQHVRKLSEVKIRVEGFRAFVTTRYQTKTEGGENFTIWAEGEQAYWADQL